MTTNREVVLITGSSGYIGSALARELSTQYQVIGLDAQEPREKIPNVSYHTVDITSDKNVASTLREMARVHGPHLHSVVHLVAYYSFSGEEDERYQTITVKGTESLLTHLRKNFSVEQFIFSSSMLVYAPVKKGKKIVEDSPLAPSWPYPRSKVEVENLLQKIHGDVPVVNLRIAGIYDENCHQPTLANQIIRIHEAWATSVPFPGNPDHGQAMLHLQDLVEATRLLIERRKKFSGFETFVLGEEEVMSYRELQSDLGILIHQRPWPTLRIPTFVAKFGAELMKKLPVIRQPFIKPWMVPHADEHFALSLNKVRRTLDWEPRHQLKKDLPIMVQNLKDDPEKWYGINKIEKPFYRPLNLIGSEREKTQLLAFAFLIFAGLWQLFTHFTFSGTSDLETLNAVISGGLVAVLGALSMIPTLRWLRWTNASLGIWIMFSPLLFSTPAAASYLNDTLIGTLITLASVYTPSPNLKKDELGIPPGWSYNPSTAGQRLPIMLLGMLGFLFSRYLASYQLGHIPEVWDPIFGNGTERVLTSSISKAFPVSDAGLGAFTYLLDVIAASMGGKYRWRTMPWAVVLFGFMIIPAGVTSIALVMLQPIGVGAWCSICLFTAFLMLMMVPPAVDEVVASFQFLAREKKQGRPFWRTFWVGKVDGESEAVIPEKKAQGSLLPLVLSTLMGTWLLFAPAVLGIEGLAANNIYIVASLIVTFSIIGMGEVARIVRLMNFPLGLWLSVSPWILGGMDESAQWHSLILGLLVAVLSLPAGKRSEKFGNIDHWVHWTPLRVQK